MMTHIELDVLLEPSIAISTRTTSSSIPSQSPFSPSLSPIVNHDALSNTNTGKKMKKTLFKRGIVDPSLKHFNQKLISNSHL